MNQPVIKQIKVPCFWGTRKGYQDADLIGDTEMGVSFHQPKSVDAEPEFNIHIQKIKLRGDIYFRICGKYLFQQIESDLRTTPAEALADFKNVLKRRFPKHFNDIQ